MHEVVELGHVVDGYIGKGRGGIQEILMMCLGRNESTGVLDAGDDWGAEDFGAVELSDVGLGDPFLRLILREGGRPVLSPCVWALPVELGRVVHDGEKDQQQ